MHKTGWYIDLRIVFTPSFEHEIPDLVYTIWISLEKKFGAVVNGVLKNFRRPTQEEAPSSGSGRRSAHTNGLLRAASNSSLSVQLLEYIITRTSVQEWRSPCRQGFNIVDA